MGRDDYTHGNLVTNIHRSFLDGSRVTNVEAGLFPIGKLSDNYRQVGLGCPLALFGTAGYLEIAYNGDRADARLNIGVGINVNLTVEPDVS